MKIRIKFFLIAVLAIGVLSFVGCQPVNRDHYKTPPWLGGSSIETLEEEGNYTNFLRLMEIANYKEPVSKQLFTLFVPDDDAFEAYFSKIGKNSIEEFTKEEAVQLFTLHVLRNPRSRFLLIYEYVYGEFQGPSGGKDGEYMSLFNRKQTPSVATPYKENVRYYEEFKGQELLMTSASKYVSLFTDEWFHDYGSFDAEGDYLFMFPESSWREGYTSDMPGTNWHSAMVLPHENLAGDVELEGRTASGFIYYVDRVVEPIPSIDEYLEKNQDKYGKFYDLLQRFATYSKSDEKTADGKVLYEKGYDLVYDLADETAGSINIDDNKFPQNMWTAFVPTDDVFEEYLNNSVLTDYTSIDSVPRVTLYYILQSQLSETVVLMSQMESAFFNAFGDQMEKTREDLNQAGSFMASNGVVYESKEVIVPYAFTCVPGELFFDKQYSTLLLVLSKTESLINLSNPDRDVILFASTNEQLKEYGITYDPTDDVINFKSPANGQVKPMDNEDLVLFAQSQYAFVDHSDFSGDGFIQTGSGTYIHYSGNVIEAAENQSSGNTANVVSVEQNELNGYLVKVDNPIQPRYSIGDYMSEDDDISIFFNLMYKDFKMFQRGTHPVTREKILSLTFFNFDEEWTVLAPTNDAMMKAINEGIIPDVTVRNWDDDISAEELNSLRDWVRYHFIKGDVIFDDGKLSGNFDTNFEYSLDGGKTILYTQIEINNEPNNLSILDATGQEVVVDHAKANTLIKKGVVHKLDSVLKLKE